MKKLVIVLTIVISVGSIASQAQAWWPFSGGSVTNAGSAVTADIRAQMAAKEAAYDTLVAQPNPDPKQVSRLSQEIVSLSNQLRATTQVDTGPPVPQGNYNTPPMMGRGGYGMDYGNGWGMGCW